MKYDTAVLLGEGAMGEVYRAWDPDLGRTVALKFLHRSQPALVERFLREARLQARVEHAHVCRVYGVGESNGRPYICMQYIEGQTLDEAAPSMRLEEKVAVLRDVAEAVHAAHRTGLVHRDLKPTNIMVERGEDGWHAWVLDFGLAREAEASGLTETGAVLGTPSFMAPEQARGDVHHLDRRTDVYALGAVLYYLLAGRPPFEGKGTAEVLVKLLREEPVPPRRIDANLPGDLEAVALTCLEKEPPRRYVSARALAEELQRFLDGEPVRARRPSLAGRLLRKARRHRAAVAAAAVGVAVVSVLGGLGLWARFTAAEQARLAQRFGQEVERIESTLRQAYLLPLHDIRPAKEQVRARMKLIEAEMAVRGAQSRGPGHYAIGRGLLEVGELEAARTQLEKAWAEGYRPPEVRQMLGRALGELYVRALEESRALPRAAREERLKELDISLRRPALLHLAGPDTAGVDRPDHWEGLIAYYDRRYDEALDLARRAAAEPDELYEARRLEGDVHAQVGRNQWSVGDFDAALGSYARAGEAYRQALTIGRSDPRLHEAECLRRVLVLELVLMKGTQAQGEYADVLEACGAALAADPDRALPYQLRARAGWRWADALMARGEDARPVLDAAIADGRVAYERDPRDYGALMTLAAAYWGLAEHHNQAGGDPSAAYEDAVRFHEEALAVRETASVSNNLAGVLYALAVYRLERGEDALPLLDRALAVASPAAARDPKHSPLQSTLGTLHVTRARYRLDRGEDSRSDVEAARRACRAAVELNSKNIYGFECAAAADSLAGRHAVGRGEDPEPVLRLSDDAARSQMAVNPEMATGPERLAENALLRAEWRSRHGRDPRPALREARRQFARALVINPKSRVALSGQVATNRVGTEWARR